MAKKIPGRNGGTLQNWEKGESGNPAGRPRKIAGSFKHEGYTKYEISDSITKILAMNQSELKKLSASEDITAFERIILKVISESLKKGKLDLIDYAFPKLMASEINGSLNINASLPKDPVEASKAYQELMK
jgi:hypothetical protein